MHIKLDKVAHVVVEKTSIACACLTIVQIRHAPQAPSIRFTAQYGNVKDGKWVGVGGALPAITLRDRPEERGLVANPAHDPNAEKPGPAKVEGCVREACTTYSDLKDKSEGGLLAFLLASELVIGEVIA